MLRLAALLVFFGTASAAPMFTAPQLRADLAELQRALQEMPPDLAHSADINALDRATRQMAASFEDSPPLDRDAAWRLFATLNPILADGHLFVGFVDWRGDSRAHLAAGGALFPFEIRVSANCELRVRASLGGGATPFAGQELRSVDKMAAATLCEQMLARVHGDTRTFRADLMSRRFWFYYWKLNGAPASFDLEFEGGKGLQRIEASRQLPQVLADEASFDRLFRFELVDDDTAALTLGSFAWPDSQRFLDFTRGAFEKLRAAGTRTLIIDLRDNGGGDDVMWIEGILPYMATKPFRTGSNYRKRVVVANPGKGEVVGSVVDGQIETWFPPQPVNPLRYTGAVHVLVGPGTYSSAVLFSNVIQDFGFGHIVGTGGSVRTKQSGGARRTTLTHTGLMVVAPRFVLARPSGARDPVLLMPDIPLDDSLPMNAIAKVLRSRR